MDNILKYKSMIARGVPVEEICSLTGIKCDAIITNSFMKLQFSIITLGGNLT